MTNDLALPFTDRLRADLKIAMQARAREEAAVLRALIGAVDNAQAVPLDPARKPGESAAFGDRANEVARRALGADDLRGILAAQIAERETAAQELERLGRADRAEMLRAEAAIVARYLP
jgi:uncharacterized protein YqeY